MESETIGLLRDRVPISCLRVAVESLRFLVPSVTEPPRVIRGVVHRLSPGVGRETLPRVAAKAPGLFCVAETAMFGRPDPLMSGATPVGEVIALLALENANQ